VADLTDDERVHVVITMPSGRVVEFTSEPPTLSNARVTLGEIKDWVEHESVPSQ
jgi:hypothetical protein